MSKKICMVCGIEFSKRYKDSKKQWDDRKYCSWKCKINSMYNNPKDIWKYIDKKTEDDCWEWGRHKTMGGYGQITINKKTYHVHRLVYKEIHGSIPKGMCVCHKCNNPSCCNPSHLYLGTYADNSKQMVNEGRWNGNIKLTAENVLEIRKLYSTGEYYQTELGRMFGICPSQICRIVNKLKQKYLNMEE